MAFAPLLLLVISLPNQVLLKCRMDGALRSSCCCPGDGAAEASTTFPASTLTAACCCERQATAAEARLMEATSAVHGAFVAAPPFVAVLSPDFIPSVTTARVVQYGGAAREGPPLILLKQSFLI